VSLPSERRTASIWSSFSRLSPWNTGLDIGRPHRQEGEHAVARLPVELHLAAADLLQPFLEPLDQEGIVRDEARGGDLRAQVLFESYDENAIAEGHEYTRNVLLPRGDAHRGVVPQVQILGHDEPVQPRALGLADSLAPTQLDLGATTLLADGGDFQAERFDHM